MANTTANERLLAYWEKPVRELASRQPNVISDEQKERHRLYSLLAMGATHYFWNGYKRGRDGQYPQNVQVVDGSPKYLKNDYYGHNILALAVDFDGRVIDFEMNHNNLFNSSAEHAEARLIRRIYTIASLTDTWNLTGVQYDRNDVNTFTEVSIYTTLESCSQCSGVMALAQVKEIIYLHSDDGMYLIGNILRNLTEATKLQAPNPIDGSEFLFEYFDELNAGTKQFNDTVSDTNPFFKPMAAGSKVDASKSLTSFLCTKAAHDIYERAKNELLEYISGAKPLLFPDYKPCRQVTDSKGVVHTIESGLSNKDAVAEIANYYTYIQTNGRRGTPHK